MRFWRVADHIAENRKNKFRRKYPRECASLYLRLENVMDTLNSGVHPMQLKYGFLRSEGDGIYRIAQRSFPGSKESRLYISFDTSIGNIHVLGIGSKETQREDIKQCKKEMKLIRSGGKYGQDV